MVTNDKFHCTKCKLLKSKQAGYHHVLLIENEIARATTATHNNANVTAFWTCFDRFVDLKDKQTKRQILKKY